jgi:hypothetical protein
MFLPAADLSYEEMTRKMLKYLTSRYRCYGPDSAKCTVLEFAQATGANDAAAALQTAIADLERAMVGIESKRGPAATPILSLEAALGSNKVSGSGSVSQKGSAGGSSAVSRDEVTRERVHQAKARLQAFRDQGPNSANSSAVNSTYK